MFEFTWRAFWDDESQLASTGLIAAFFALEKKQGPIWGNFEAQNIREDESLFDRLWEGEGQIWPQ